MRGISLCPWKYSRLLTVKASVDCVPYTRVSQPGFRETLGFREMSLGVPREIVIDKKQKKQKTKKKQKKKLFF
jgi:hypothetical protein